MRRFAVCFVACSVLALLMAGGAGAQQATVTRVVDGDTIEISPAIDGGEEVRLIGVDTPETVDPNTPVQPYGSEASRFTMSELDGRRVQLEFDEEREDQYGRLLAYVHVGREMFNEVLLEEGYAQLYIVPPNDTYEARFEQAQQQARSAGRRLWGLPRDQLCQLTDRGNGIGEGSPGCEGANSPGGSPPPAAVADKNCADFPSRAAAQREYERDRSDPHNLDADDDGEACEEFDYGGGGGGTSSDNNRGAADGQYGRDEVIVETVPKKKRLSDTGGAPLILPAGAVLLSAGLLVGYSVIRRAT